jgi:hypothetical protein
VCNGLYYKHVKIIILNCCDIHYYEHVTIVNYASSSLSWNRKLWLQVRLEPTQVAHVSISKRACYTHLSSSLPDWSAFNGHNDIQHYNAQNRNKNGKLSLTNLLFS